MTSYDKAHKSGHSVQNNPFNHKMSSNFALDIWKGGFWDFKSFG